MGIGLRLWQGEISGAGFNARPQFTAALLHTLNIMMIIIIVGPIVMILLQ